MPSTAGGSQTLMEAGATFLSIISSNNDIMMTSSSRYQVLQTSRAAGRSPCDGGALPHRTPHVEGLPWTINPPRPHTNDLHE